MKKIENECLHCDTYCMGSSCPNRRVVRFYCDRCGDEAMLYNYYGEEICEDCLLKEFDIVEGSEY